MKKIRTLMLTALALIMGAMTAFASPENPTNEEVMTALTRATTVFESVRLPTRQPLQKRAAVPLTRWN